MVVDMQNDFMDGGALPVPGSLGVLPKVNEYVRAFSGRCLPVLFTRDWHPPDHISFASRGGPWPPHCVRGTGGAGFHGLLDVPAGATVISKAGERDGEAYSAFQGTRAAETLRGLSVRELYVCGVATDYCVRQTVNDALSEGFLVFLLMDAVKGIDDEGSKAAVDEMVRNGAVPLRMDGLLARLG
ncbi:MAG: isochorismatase family protein [Nitrososphaerota archaeon]|nr:isochorismatase family protein [Nitrososphaerota archaeon]MDG6938795.1 isochorismatase family protein [Nitrososphaerota archaeon]